MMNIIDIIENKKNKKALSKDEIDFFIQGYTKGVIPDYQISALLMAIVLNGMNDEETSNLTLSMVNSGEKIDLSKINGVTVDKHSTGGVGDKTTLILAPIVASLGGKVAKMSGRGLGHTGGTIDKLEAIEGFRVQLNEDEFFNQVNEIGLSIVSQSGNLTPADKKLYALRDVTATVNSISLIASSVMSKKIAAGSDGIVLDVKMGSGAFMKNLDTATKLSETMVEIGKNAKRKTIALITNMDIPLGRAIGNSLEVKEAVEVLNGYGPKDLTELCVELATYMIMLCNGKDKIECEKLVRKVIKNGEALEKLKQMVKAQGGNEDWIENPNLFPKANYKHEIYSSVSGYISKMDTEKIGKISCACGAGRLKKDDGIDYTAGIIMAAKVGDYVKAGNLLATLYSSVISDFKEQEANYKEALTFSDKETEKPKLVYKIVG